MIKGQIGEKFLKKIEMTLTMQNNDNQMVI
jgi:hypothetical protein